MNPSYMASMKAISTLYLNAFLGIEPKPVVKKDKETSINGRAFAPGHGIQQEVSSEEKEAKVRAHLDKLAAETSARYLEECSKYPVVEYYQYPRSDMVEAAEEEQERLDAEKLLAETKAAFKASADKRIMDAEVVSEHPDAASLAVIHTGERMNIEEARFEAQ